MKPANSMNLPRLLLASAFACCATLFTHAQPERSHEDFGQEKTVQNLNHILLQNRDGENLGRIRGLNLDLANGRIVEVFIVTGDFLGMGGKVTAVPPSRLIGSPDSEICYLDATDAQFKSAPEVNISRRGDYRSHTRIAAAYRHFGVDPYFAEPGNSVKRTGDHPKTNLGYIERANYILGLPVGNLQNESFGKVSSLNFDLKKGAVRSVIVRAPGLLKASSVIPASAFDFNSTHTGLLLDDTKREFANQPRIIVTESANNQPATTKEEPFIGEVSAGAATQGRSYADLDLTASITRKIRQAKIKGLSAQVTSMDGRVILRGSALSDTAKAYAGQIAVNATRLENVDNQIIVAPAAR
jgi:sporulation protein YlmC with PRC-barrel domain